MIFLALNYYSLSILYRKVMLRESFKLSEMTLDTHSEPDVTILAVV